ncbi:hypothetical protein [Streptomyces sp. NPDC056296]|uniref:hypothetical protein n=1 Tax=Streptomyces sp. NPDC056296 TaxID=3345775 RepID=UPI0035DE0C5A
MDAVVGDTAREAGLVELLGADQVVTSAARIGGPVGFLLDNVGGPLLGELLGGMVEDRTGGLHRGARCRWRPTSWSRSG